jgi:hypothetical protein
MTINTVGIQTGVNCANPNQLSVNPVNATATTISATSVDGCTVQVTVNPTSADQQYAVVNVPGCGNNSSDVAFQPVRLLFGLPYQREVFIPYRFSFGSGNKTQITLPVFFACRPYSFSM